MYSIHMISLLYLCHTILWTVYGQEEPIAVVEVSVNICMSSWQAVIREYLYSYGTVWLVLATGGIRLIPKRIINIILASYIL